ncbi:MAG TPA: TolC family protein [Bryobacteraceae bacterium]|nr:TolC family protein [Bryobacteraceae bacterium]
MPLRPDAGHFDQCKRTVLALIGAAATFLSGCAHYAAHPIDAAVSEQRFRARSLDDPGLKGFVNRPNWPPAKLTLNDLDAIALYFDPELDVARSKLNTARAAIVTAGARPNPSLSLAGGWTNAPESPVVIDFFPAITIETRNKRGLRILEAQKLADAAQVNLYAAAWQTLSRVRSAWLDFAMNVRLETILGDQMAAQDAAVTLLEKRLTAGEVARPEVDIARAASIQDELEVGAARNSGPALRAALAGAVGIASLPDIDTTLPETPASPVPDNITKAGLVHRADIRQSLLGYAAAEAALQLEIAKQTPDIQITPGYAFDEGHHKITFGPGFDIPLLNRNQGPIAEAEARRAQAEAEFNALQAKAIGEMSEALARYTAAQQDMSAARGRLTSLQQTREAATRRAVEAGEEDRLALASAHIETVAAARASFDAQRRLQEALGALDDAVQQPLEPGLPLPDPESKK